jgi:hypothetical protein
MAIVFGHFVCYTMAMMTLAEFTERLVALRLSLAEAALLLGVSERSVRRWSEEGVPGPAAAALRAWCSLDQQHLPWKPDSISILKQDHDQLRRMREHDQLLDQVMKEVEARGGPANPWTVDLDKCRASFAHAEVGFHKLANGSFSPSTYRRLDRTPTDADKPEISDAVYSIAKAFSRARAASKALADTAQYTRDRAEFFVRNGPKLETPVAISRHKQAIVEQADRLDQLALAAAEGRAAYEQFNEILSDLHRLGFFPDVALVSAVARNMVG